ncbi:hypothetical protein KS4_22200 [Poriferisphaera corsica]|uniref:Uncharacterized protein n=1 Tax=Poriferisphaera corsica TaxID=2528020 RepID=A0A517YVA4_9BACT|nr:hypothetical protein [Poriferisphaera corsica]QDU34158.1 hypothetical protein KS4_22200 [Poriferisphaera corsica]
MKLRKWPIVLSLVIVVSLPLIISAQNDDEDLGNERANPVLFEAEVVGLSVVKSTEGLGFDEVVVDGEVGTTVTAVLSVVNEGYQLIQLEPENSKLLDFRDSGGKDLIGVKKNAASEAGSMTGMLLKEVMRTKGGMSEDGRRMVLEFHGRELSMKGARGMKITALLSLKVAEGEREELFKGLPLKPGPIFDLNQYGIRVASIRPASLTGADVVVALTVPLDVSDEIAEIRFMNEAGEDITVSRTAYTALLDTTQQEFALRERPQIMEMRITFYKNPMRIIYPLVLDVSVGL